VHLTGAGSCTITATQAGNADFRPAPPVAQSFNIEAAPCDVPNVVGKPLAVARSTIARKHCRTGKVTYRYSRSRKRGVVIAQNRTPGLELQPGARIDLRVSRGRPPRKR
jgi:beta-lactam-binding protein with PASTA domain